MESQTNRKSRLKTGWKKRMRPHDKMFANSPPTSSLCTLILLFEPSGRLPRLLEGLDIEFQIERQLVW